MLPIQALAYVMDHAFRSTLARLIDERYESRRAFVRAAEPERDENTAQAYLAKVLSGKNYPLLDRSVAWADALGLTGDAKQGFLDLAACAHLPDAVRADFERIVRQHRELVRKHKLVLSLLQSKLGLTPDDLKDLDITE